jgi:hypothetical protein
MHASHFYSFLILYIGKSLEPDGEKAFDAEVYGWISELYEKHYATTPSMEELNQYCGVEMDLYFLVSFLSENNEKELETDFVEQVMNQFEGRPEDMMIYVERYISEPENIIVDDDDDDEVLEEIEPPPAGSPPLQIEAPILQIGGGSPTPAIIENVVEDMDTTRDEKKRSHEMTVVTRQQSRSNLLEEENN